MPLQRTVFLLCCAALLWGCTTTPGPGIGEPVKWSQLDGWKDDRHAESWGALLRSCSKLDDHDQWFALCRAAVELSNPTDRQVRAFYEQWFVPHAIYGVDGARSGLITGYYEPLLSGSLQRNERYRYPIYKRPHDLIAIELSDLYPELEGKRLRGRLSGNKVVPYYSRSSLDENPDLLRGNELAWVDDPIALFFLHIQGSGRVMLPDGTVLGVGYADQNGHPYQSIGRELISLGELHKDDVNLFSIREWLRNNPSRVSALFRRNPSYVFFSERIAPEVGPYGSLDVPLVAERSIAVDAGVIALGTPVWLETTLPHNMEPYRRVVLAQDTGGAIKGHIRADVFWGQGERAERMAGLMKQTGRLYVLQPRDGKLQPAD